MGLTADPALVGLIADRLATVRQRIERAGGLDVEIVAVTKGFGPEVVAAAVAAGCTRIGENYAQEAVAKWRALTDPAAQLHFIGRLQTNKVRMLSPMVQMWQTVDRVSAGAAIASAVPRARVLVQVNVSDEPTKGGCHPSETDALVDELGRLGLQVEGLMTIGRAGSPGESRDGFATLRRLADRLGLSGCSMGMSDDLELAVAEGSTMVRVGSALFGMRPSPTTAELA